MSLTEAEVAICNQSLDAIGAKAFTVDVQTSVQGVKANLHYGQTRNALLRSFVWPFASARAELTSDATPDFEWDYEFSLPDDYSRLKELYGFYGTELASNRWTIEGSKLLCNDSTVDMKYIKKVTDPTVFDPLFTEVLILQLALKLLPALAGTKTGALRERLLLELKNVLSMARTACREEVNVSGRSDWNLARFRTGTV